MTPLFWGALIAIVLVLVYVAILDVNPSSLNETPEQEDTAITNAVSHDVENV